MAMVSSIVERVRAGDRITFFQGFYGNQWVELSRGWLIRRKFRYELSAQEIDEIKNLLRARRVPASKRRLQRA